MSSVGPVALEGTISVTPTKTSTYTLTAIGSGGSQSASVTITVLPNIDCWGDSLAAGGGGSGVSIETVLTALSGAIVYNGGVGGETSTQIATRMLASPDKFGDVIIIWAGHNNAFNPTQVLSDIASMVNALTDPKRFLILSLLNGGSQPSGSSGYEQIADLNASLQSAFPNNFLDIRKLLITNGLSFEGLTPTVQDQADIAADCTPTSLRADDIHLNGKGYDFVGNEVHQWLKANSMEQVN